MTNYVRFDWAVKRLLRQKANFVVLEGFLSTLLGEPVRIQRMLESEGNQEDENDKFNRVDMLAENSRNELLIIEVQNTRELDYFHRILYGVSKVITEYIHLGEGFSKVRKVYSINIVYFDLGQGSDYVYHGYTVFRGIHTNELLKLSNYQMRQYYRELASELYPEYYLLRVDEFDQKSSTPLDEWISFLKTGEIPEGATAPGLPEARERLRFERMNESERQQYEVHLSALQYQKSVLESGIREGREEGLAEGLEKGREEGLEKGREEGLTEGLKKSREEKITIARKALERGLSSEDVATLFGMTEEEIAALKI
ncbi:MAG: Rpn family recombination-promoting nuclease/putative transposase [Tannerella sp.]|jgi:predicted transposase/invertase (TIGR01784 family)|nr:Rpn family recombination-promoting nuclease/putative transposase [Tannerella sp.]